MRAIHVFVFLAVLASATGLSHAGWFEIGVNSVSAAAEVGAHFGSDPQGRLALGGRGVYNDDRDTSLGVFIARFDAVSDGVPGLSFGVGIDVMAGPSNDRDVGAAAISIESEFAPAGWKGAFAGGGLAFAPRIFAWSDTESLFGWSVRGGYRINPKARIFVEYEEVRADFVDLGRRDVDEGFKVGFGVRF